MNVKHTAKRCKITDPLSFMRRELLTMYYKCKRKCVDLLTDLPWLRKQFQLAMLHNTLENGREDEASNLQTPPLEGKPNRKTGEP